MASYQDAKGLIFNIVHGSFVDGYGIRTTIFLKGCPLRCRWCCNPEGQSFQQELKVIYTHCSGCGECISQCQNGALALEDGIVKVDWAKCRDNGDCVKRCWYDAMELVGKWYSVDEMFEIVRRDRPFYDSSGGGLTIGGGEATWYPEFCLGLIEKCHSVGIKVAIDTCGYVDSPLGLEVLKQADLLLFDLKGMDEERHKVNTGVSNQLILRNLKQVNEWRKPIIIRIPVIPGYNDSPAELTAMAELLSTLGSVERLDLIAFHEFGRVKYDQLGMEYKVKSRPIPAERQQELKEFFASYGLNVQLGG